MMKRGNPAVSDGPLGPVFPWQRPAGTIGCPVKASLGVIGHKWSLVVLRDVAFLRDATFGAMLRRSPGLTPRILSARLRELRAEGLIDKIADPRDDRVFHYRMTPKGKDTIPVLTALASFGMRHLADRVFEDGRPREMEDVFPGRGGDFLGRLYQYARMDLDPSQPPTVPPSGIRRSRARIGRAP